MLQELVDDPAEADPEALFDRYREALAAVVERVGVDAVAEATDLDRADVSAIADGTHEPTLAEAAAVLAVDREPAAEAIRQESLDHLLLGMTTAVVDVDTLAATLSLDRSATELQQRIEGRAPMTLREYAYLQAAIADRSP